MTWASKNKGVHAACDDGKVECTRHGGSEGSTGVTGANVIVEGDGKSNGSLGDGGREHDGNTSLPRLDVDAAFADTEAVHTIGPASSEAERASTLKEAGTEAGRPFLK